MYDEFGGGVGCGDLRTSNAWGKSVTLMLDRVKPAHLGSVCETSKTHVQCCQLQRAYCTALQLVALYFLVLEIYRPKLAFAG